MASIDLKDAFYYVPVAAHHQKYLKFFANGYLKACVHYLLSKFYFSLNDSPLKSMKNAFYFI